MQSVNDEELWDDLITKSMQKPAFVSALLEHIGGHVDPIKLIKRIPEGLEIEGLRDRLVKIISDFNLQVRPFLWGMHGLKPYFRCRFGRDATLFSKLIVWI